MSSDLNKFDLKRQREGSIIKTFTVESAVSSLNCQFNKLLFQCTLVQLTILLAVARFKQDYINTYTVSAKNLGPFLLTGLKLFANDFSLLKIMVPDTNLKVIIQFLWVTTIVLNCINSFIFDKGSAFC